MISGILFGVFGLVTLILLGTVIFLNFLGLVVFGGVISRLLASGTLGTIFILLLSIMIIKNLFFKDK